MKRIFLLVGLLFTICNPFYAQINTFPYTEGFEDDFVYGNNVYFLPNWWGNIVQQDTIYRDESRPYAGSAHLTMIPKEEELKTIIQADLDLTGVENLIVEFYAASESNLDGNKTTRLFIQTSNDSGLTWFPKIEIGGHHAFPNSYTPYKKYYYALHAENFNKENVKFKMFAKTGAMHGTAAKLLIDEVTFFESAIDTFPPTALEPQIITEESVLVLFSEPVDSTALIPENYSFSNGITVSEAQLSSSLDSVLLIMASPLIQGLIYEVTISGVQDTSGNVMEPAEFEILYNTVEEGLVISEIFYDEPPEGQNDNLEFIEIYNASCEPIQLGGLRIKEAIFSSRLPYYLLQPGEYFVLAKSSTSFQSFFGFSPDFQWKAGNLDNEGDEYIQFLPAEHHSTVLVDSVVYQTSAPWPTEAAGLGTSIELCNGFLDNADGANWSASTTLAGTYNGYEIYASPGQGCDPALIPLVDLGEDENYCGITSVELDAGNEGSLFLWSTGETTKTINVTESGLYSVVVNNGSGASYDTIAVNIVPEIIANWEVPETIQCHSSEIQFTDLTEDAVSWLWDFGDENYAEEQNPIHVYESDGTYSASLIVSNSFGCTDTLYTSIEVSEIEASFELESSDVCVDQIVSFVDMSIGATSWEWDFGDGVYSTFANPLHVYDAEGEYTVSLTASNSDGCSDEISFDVFASICSGIEEGEIISSVLLYPNPSNEKFEVNVQLNSASDLFIEIIDVHGRMVFNDSYVNIKDVKKEFYTVDFGKGIYLVKISTGSEFKWEKLIIN